ncbi:hypothetical protein [Kribbella kalugense]|uniref:Uncharacterized protein n=1 Tax=Kribbella kalugense TaxID=2512221 RepID=A0A4V6Q8J3_9ACTN|nr:hypothetical protein [Kribbella kalugense]TDW24394.1 hypothetical protein EV650_3273 [Kribbella kalugense]
MTTTLQQEIERWEAELRSIAENSTSDNWFLEERRFAEAQHTITAYRGHILPALANEQPHDAILAHEIEHHIDHLEDLRNDLYRTVHPPTSHQQVAETIAALRALSSVALRLERATQTV